ncbi:MAG: ferritin [Armatimonadota bacterium]|nr:ferritin [Armatimonadota bacterium]
MLIGPKMNKAINEQIGREFGASLQYIAIAAYFDGQNLPQLAKYFYRQATEEHEHAMRFLKYVLEAGGKAVIPAIDAPKPDFGSAEEAVKLSLRWEEDVTRQIHALLDLAGKEHDYTAANMLQWFVSEQLEEVSSMERLLSVVRRAGEGGLLLVEDYVAREGHPEDKGED